MTVPSLPGGHSKSSVPAGEIVTRSADLNHYEPNGAAEAAVKVIKALFGKMSRNGNVNVDAFRTGLLEFRITLRAHGFSPSQLLFWHNLRLKVLS